MSIPKGFRHKKESKEKMRKSHQGKHRNESNNNWKGEKVGYLGLHGWIRRHKPKPIKCEGDGCKNSPYDLANISGKYKRDVNDFEWLCRKCHMVKDGRLHTLIKKYSRKGIAPWNKGLKTKTMSTKKM